MTILNLKVYLLAIKLLSQDEISDKKNNYWNRQRHTHYLHWLCREVQSSTKRELYTQIKDVCAYQTVYNMIYCKNTWRTGQFSKRLVNVGCRHSGGELEVDESSGVVLPRWGVTSFQLHISFMATLHTRFSLFYLQMCTCFV